MSLRFAKSFSHVASLALICDNGKPNSSWTRRYRFLPPPLRFRGTLPPARRASASPIAIACLRLVTFLPELPLRSVPRFRSRITFSTFCEAFLPYLRPPRFFAIPLLLSGIWPRCRVFGLKPAADRQKDNDRKGQANETARVVPPRSAVR